MSSNVISSSPATFAGKRHHQQPPSLLLPGLPDHIAHLCLSHVHPSILYSVSHSWRRLIYSPSFPPFLSLYALLLPIDSPESIKFSSFDPISSRWVSLPPPPPLPENHQPLRIVIRHPMFMSRNLSVQSISVSGKLLVLAGTTDHLLPALPLPLIFDPVFQQWSSGPPLAVPRRWCAAGTVRGSVVVASGIGSNYSQDVARSVEKWDMQKIGPGGKRKSSIESCRHPILNEVPYEHSHTSSCCGERKRNSIGNCRHPILNTVPYEHSHVSGCGEKRKRSSIEKCRYPILNAVPYDCKLGWNWKKLGPMRDAKFSREAIDAVGWRGKLCLVNVKGDFAKEGVVYDLETDEWEDMPEGMLAGWRGPAAAMDEKTIYTVDESRGVLRKYNSSIDGWEIVMESENLRGAEQMAAGGGRVCVVCSGGVEIVVVDVVVSPPRLVVMETPAGFQAVSVHILPRMSSPDLEFPAMSME